MKTEQLIDVFVKQIGARKDSGAFLVPSEADASLFVAMEGETLTIARVTRLEPADTLVTVDTAKGERFVVALASVLAVKIDRSDSNRRERSAGFGK